MDNSRPMEPSCRNSDRTSTEWLVVLLLSAIASAFTLAAILLVFAGWPA